MVQKKKRAAAPKVRIRRTAEQARESILDAAELELVSQGPDGFRIQDVAAAVGMRHPTVLHHFGSREELVQAVVARAMSRLQNDLVATMASAQEFAGAALMERVMATLGDQGYARLIAWLALGGREQVDSQQTLRAVAGVLHARRVTSHKQDPPYEDTAFAILLAAMALLADAVVGPVMRQSAGYADDPDAARRFRVWLNALLEKHLLGQGGASCG